MADHAPMSFSDSDNSSSVCYPDAPSAAATTAPESPPPCTPCNPDVAALRILSASLGSVFQSPAFDFCADVRISVASSAPPSPRVVPVHRCVLSARSDFFRELFAGEKGAAGGLFEMEKLVSGFQVGFDPLVAVLRYLYSGRVGPFPREVCACVDEECPHIGCRPAVDCLVEALYASFAFKIAELVSLFQRRLLDILEKVEKDDLLVIVSVANLCNKDCGRLLTRCIEIVVNSDLDIMTLEKALPPDIVKQIVESRLSLGLHGPKWTVFPDKHVERIHRALDSDDVELLRLLLTEGHTTLDNAYALHYAVAHCDSKTTVELLELGLADVNHWNLRGYTVLHMAAIRREPKIIVSLLTKGACPSNLTNDGRTALKISKRVTKCVDYYRSTEEGKASPKDRLCVEILEQAERRDPLLGEASVSLAMAGDDLRSRLLYLENRVALARLSFPEEARVAMDIAQVHGTLEFKSGTNTNLSAGNQKSAVDLNETPLKIQEEHLSRMKALLKTVELGKRFFPRCSRELDKIMDDDDTADLAFLGNESSEEQLLKNQRFQELQDILRKAFTADKEESDKFPFSSSSSSTSVAGRRAKFSRRW